ncbi:MAG: site-specific DNA-methyltransferase [Burkholderiales bacterium]|jgi:adenine-specific DNA-methyltransferase|nr:site-specific DNA-methyltransferase [Burkholderiales bacterium]
MDKMKFETPDGNAANVARIEELFPAAVSEGKVNFEMLRTLLGDEIYGDEAYEFTWVGKREAVREAGRPVRKTLRPCPEESKEWDTTENLYIEGDNLDVLKLLQESYLGKVKMIYIDPPYNTGSDFVYRDKFAVSREEYEDEAGVYDDEGDRLFKNTETNGRFHSDWCSMIYPRLVLARNLLHGDGVIFISIDDNEVDNLRKCCNEVFGESNFVAQLIWQRAFSPKNDARFVSNSHDYVAMYARNLNAFKIGRLPRTEEANARYSNPDNDPRGVWMSSDISVKTYNPNTDYPITAPSGRVIEPPTGRCWSLSKNEFLERLQDNRIWFGPDGNGTPRIKRFLSDLKFDGMAPTSIMMFKDVGHSQEGSQEVTKLLEAGVFDGPKPVRLLRRLLTLANLGQDDIVLDFFSGSATTAHAVMQLNAEDGGRRKFIMAQLPEICAEGTEAAKAGFATICEIGKERIRRAGDKILAEWKAKRAQAPMTNEWGGVFAKCRLTSAFAF